MGEDELVRANWPLPMMQKSPAHPRPDSRAHVQAMADACGWSTQRRTRDRGNKRKAQLTTSVEVVACDELGGDHSCVHDVAESSSEDVPDRNFARA